MITILFENMLREVEEDRQSLIKDGLFPNLWGRKLKNGCIAHLARRLSPKESMSDLNGLYYGTVAEEMRN